MRGEAFYRRLDDDVFEATAWTRGPWSPKHQHGGPPSALVAGRLEEMVGDPLRVVRVSIEIVRPVPIGTLRLERSIRRDGRAVKAMVGQLFDGDDKLVLQAEALALAGAKIDVETEHRRLHEPTPEASSPALFPVRDSEPGYPGAMDLRLGRGDFGDGDAMAWMRMRVSLLEGAEPSPLERVLVAADSGNGISQAVSPFEYTFMNPDLTVTLHRPAVGQWIGLGARTDFADDGVGVADTLLYDEHGPIGRGIQTLLVRKR